MFLKLCDPPVKDCVLLEEMLFERTECCFCVEGLVTYCMCGYIIMFWIHKLFPEQWKENNVKKNIWAVLSDEQMSNGWPCSLLNDEQMINKVGVENQPDRFPFRCCWNITRGFPSFNPWWTLLAALNSIKCSLTNLKISCLMVVWILKAWKLL